MVTVSRIQPEPLDTPVLTLLTFLYKNGSGPSGPAAPYGDTGLEPQQNYRSGLNPRFTGEKK